MHHDPHHDPLTFLPIPLATGEVLLGGAKIRTIRVAIETEDGATQTIALPYEGGGWRMPTNALSA